MKVTKTSNQRIRDAIETKLKENGGYCPCRREQNADTKCMCKEFREQIEKGVDGECHCGLYILSND